MDHQPSISIRYASHTDTGNIRKNNQDFCAIRVFTTPQGKIIHLFCIADGIGGAPAGEVASKTAVESAISFFTTEADFENNVAPWLITRAIEVANIDISLHCNENPSRKGMGTTLTIGVVIDDKLYIGHIGDTRAYILRQDHLVQMTVDHTARQEKLDAGVPENEIGKDDDSLLIRSLGSTVSNADISYVHLRDGDTLILSTDGLHGLISQDKLKQTVSAAKNDVMHCCCRLVELANRAGGYDNITVVIGYFSGADLQKPTDSDTNQLSRICLDISADEPVSSEPITVRVDEGYVEK